MEYTFSEYEKDQEYLEKHFKESEEYAKEQAYIERITEENKLNKNSMRKLLYKEDSQGYYFTMILFETDCRLNIYEMFVISCKHLAAGRISTSFVKFKELMNKEGYVINIIQIFEQNEAPNLLYEIIEGATGNY